MGTLPYIRKKRTVKINGPRRISASQHKATAAKQDSQEYSVTNNKNPNQKQPGEKEPGTFHYNPGNMSGKTIGTSKDESEQSEADRIHGGHEHDRRKP
jgi:hypothetical protein